MNKSIKRNYLYNMLYEAFLLVVPLAVTPYVSRTLQVDAMGQYSFMLSIATYFTLLASLGFDRYAQRQLAMHKDHTELQYKEFWEILICRGMTTLISLCIYGLMLMSSFDASKQVVGKIMMLNILAIGLDSTFFFQANEDFKKVALRNILIKAIGFSCIFLFVKDSGDVAIYTFIQSMIIVLSNVSLWLYLPRDVFHVRLNGLAPFQHLKPALLLFIPSIAISVYTSLDKTLIGLITHSEAENGFYEYSEKIVKMALTMITALGAVMIPRNSYQAGRGEIAALRQNIYGAIRYVFFLGTPMFVGLFAVSSNFVPWYLGPQYDRAALLIKILSPIIVIIGMSNVLGVQYMIPVKQDKKFICSIVCGAAINFICNCIFIPVCGSVGAALGTVIAEGSVTMLMLILTNGELCTLNALRKIGVWKYLLSSLVMGCVLYPLSSVFAPTIFHSFCLVVMGIALYFGLLVAFKEQFFTKQLMQMCKSKLCKR